jgi:hypothetical protein
MRLPPSSIVIPSTAEPAPDKTWAFAGSPKARNSAMQTPARLTE